jgi:peptide deformylase
LRQEWSWKKQQNNPKVAPTLKIVQVGDPVLWLQARQLSGDEVRSKQIQELIEWIRRTMYDAPGIAGPQIGLPFQLAVIKTSVNTCKIFPSRR